MATFTATAQSTPGKVTLYFTGLENPAVDYYFEVESNGSVIASWSGSGTGSAGYTSVTLLQGVTYTLYGYATRKGVRYFVGSDTVTTASAPISAPDAPPWIATSGRTSTSISISWGSSYGASDYTIYCDGIVQGSTTGNSYTISGLSNNKSYNICVKANNSGGSSPTTCNSFSTLDGRPDAVTNLVASNITQTSFKITWSGSSLATWYEVTITGVGIYSTSSTQYSVTGLTPGTGYTVIVRAMNEFGGKSGVAVYCTTLPIPSPRPNNWVWDFTNPNLFTLTNKIAVIIDVTQWNNFTARINEFRIFKLGAGNNYNFTPANSTMTNKSVTTCINQAALAINDMVTSKLPTNYTGVTITKDIFNIMAARLNSIT